MTAVPENRMLEVWGEEKDSPKSDWERLSRRQTEKSRGGQGKGSLEPWRKERSTLVCTVGTVVSSEISITIHYVTAKGWEPYLVCVISLNSHNLKKDHWGENRSMQLSAMPSITKNFVIGGAWVWAQIKACTPFMTLCCLWTSAFHVTPEQFLQSDRDSSAGSSLQDGGDSLETVGGDYVFRKLEHLLHVRQLLKTGKDTYQLKWCTNGSKGYVVTQQGGNKQHSNDKASNGVFP